MKTEEFSSQQCVVLDNGTLKLLVTQSIGPRIMSFGFVGKENLFADLPEHITELPNGSIYHFYGGHRLWQAPEFFETTYTLEDNPVEITELDGGLMVTQPLQLQNGLQKSLEIRFSGDSQVVIKHRFTNHGNKEIACAPWAITQFKTGGVAILPQSRHDAGMLPNRSMALWSYTDMSSPRVQWGKEYVLVSAPMPSAFKIGFPNPRGWLAYWLDGALFVKHAEYNDQVDYYDYGSSSESYCNDKFLELETLGPITTLHHDDSVTHVETWSLYRDVKRPANENEVKAIVDSLALS